MFVRPLAITALLLCSTALFGMKTSIFVFRYKSPTEYALTDAIYAGDSAKVRTLAKKANLAQGGHASPALHQATVHEQLDIVDVLLEAGAHPNCVNYLGETALFKAARNGNMHIAARLLQAGAQLNQTTEQGLTPLECAIKGLPGIDATKQLAMITFSLTLGAKVSPEAKQPIVPCANHAAIQILLDRLAITSIQVRSDT